MDGYEVASVPYASTPHFDLYNAVDLTESRTPFTIKLHPFPSIALKSTQEQVNQVLNSLLNQTKIPHVQIRQIQEVRLEILEDASCRLYEVLEKAEIELDREIEQKRNQKTPFSEEELKEFLREMSEILSVSHAKVRTM